MKVIVVSILSILLFACQPNESKEKPATGNKALDRVEEPVVEYYPDGKKKMEGLLVNGERHEIWKYYHKNGFLWSEGSYWYGKRKGFSTIYFEDGKKKMEGNYKEDIKIGIWKIWNRDGSLLKEINLDEMLSKSDSLKLDLH